MHFNLNHLPEATHEVARRVQSAGGEALLVGGAVIDLIQGRAPKDFDIEVFGMDLGQIAGLFPDHSCKKVGAAFGILTLNIDGVDVDINVPRTDNKVGVGHSDFVVEMDPNMSKREAARRRDFTINTLAVDLSDGALVDEWGGFADLQAGVLRATDPTLFRQDPLRVWRAVQLLARKAKTVDPSTITLLRQMVPDTLHLPPERLFEELKKLMLKAAKPSEGLTLAFNLGLFTAMPEVQALASTGQNPLHHPEGNAWVHSLLAVDAAAELRDSLPEEDRLVVTLSAFLHDIGKPLTTVTPEMVEAGEAPKEMLWTAHGHDLQGVEPADRFLQRFTGEKGHKDLRKKVTRLVAEHMQPWNLTAGEAKQGAWTRLHRRLDEDGVTLRHLASVCQCDACATSSDWRSRSLASGAPNWEHKTSERVLDWAEHFENLPPEPKVKGRHLMAKGMKPGPMVGTVLRRCMDLQMDNPDWSVDQLITTALEA